MTVDSTQPEHIPPGFGNTNQGSDGRKLKGILSFFVQFLIVFLLLFAVLTAFRGDWYRLPHIGDAMSYLVASSNWIAEHKCAALPNGEDKGERAQGHPILYIYFMALIIYLSGDTVVLVHITHLIFSSLLVTFCWRAFRPIMALPLLIWFAVTPIFLVQSVLLNLEIPNALAIIAAILLWKERRYGACMVAGICAAWFKEPGVFLFPAFFLSYLLFRRHEKLPLSALVASFSPLIAYSIWVLTCRITYGWFLFPHNPNTATFLFEGSWIFHQAIRRLSFIYLEQGRWILFLPILWRLWRDRRHLPVKSHVLAGILFVLIHAAFCTTYYFELARYAIQVIPLLYCAAMWGMESFRRPFFLGFTLISIIVILSSNFNYHSYSTWDMRFEENLFVLDRIELAQKVAHELEKRENSGRGPVAVPMSFYRSFSVLYPGYVTTPLRVLTLPAKGRPSANHYGGYVVTDEEFPTMLRPVPEKMVKREIDRAMKRGFRSIKQIAVRDRFALIFY